MHPWGAWLGLRWVNRNQDAGRSASASFSAISCMRALTDWLGRDRAQFATSSHTPSDLFKPQDWYQGEVAAGHRPLMKPQDPVLYPESDSRGGQNPAEEALLSDEATFVEQPPDKHLATFLPLSRDGGLSTATECHTSLNTIDKPASFGSIGRRTGPHEVRPTATVGMSPERKQGALPDEALVVYRRVAKLQDRFLTTQTTLKSERDSLQRLWHSLKQSQLAGFVAPTGGFRYRTMPAKQRKEIYNKLLVDQEAFEAQMQKVTDLEQSLSKLEYKLAKLHPELLELLDACFNASQRTASGLPSSSSQHSGKTTSEYHPLELEYYERRGVARRLRDELTDHQMELQTPPDEQSSAPLLDNHPTDYSDSYLYSADFRARWQLEHEAMQLELQEAERKLTESWNACHAANLNVGRLSLELVSTPKIVAQEEEQDDVGKIELNEPPFLPHDHHGLLPRFLRTFRWPERGVSGTRLTGELTKLAEKREDIEKWVAKLPLGKGMASASGNGYPPVVEFEHTVSSSKSDPAWMTVTRTPGDELVSNDKDYVMIPDNSSSMAPNGEAVEPTGLRRVLRRWKSFDALSPVSMYQHRAHHRASADAR
ncbi:hypothetical protein LTR37_009093 [Vermiconidia calcicola]|uniref:Uncharacterized protein n=1 Tax=Vermiconidia calcicola TaxID=1690605 RepID=A0ACC3NBD4_9PEZI|nr:hypothetical protein LTR37_009093 [Vermiconidia calcicola]